MLVEQAFVMDPDTTVGKFIEKHAAELKAPIKLKGFVRFDVGEGIEKDADRFRRRSGGDGRAEVLGQIKGFGRTPE